MVYLADPMQLHDMRQNYRNQIYIYIRRTCMGYFIHEYLVLEHAGFVVETSGVLTMPCRRRVALRAALFFFPDSGFTWGRYEKNPIPVLHPPDPLSPN